VKNVNKVDRYVFAVKPEEGESFWDVNSELEYLSPYAQLIKDESKRRAGRIMTAIWLCFDPKSRVKQSGERVESEIMQDVATNFLNEKNFEWAKYKNVIEAYKKDCRSKLEKELAYWEMELETRRVYQRSLPWETMRKEKDEMLKTQKTLFNDYLEVLKEVDKERSEKKYYAGTHKSLLEREQS